LENYSCCFDLFLVLSHQIFHFLPQAVVQYLRHILLEVYLRHMLFYRFFSIFSYQYFILSNIPKYP
jgi:hypothetical protein